MLDSKMLMLAAQAAEAAHVGEVHAEPTVFGIVGPTVVVALAMIAVLALMIWKKVPAAIGKALDKKIEAIKEQLDEAKQLREEAEQLRAEYQAKADAADAEAAKIVERADNDAKAIVAKAKKDAEELVKRRGKMAEEKIAAEQRAAVSELRAMVAKAAAGAASQLIADKGEADTDARMIDEAISKLD